MKREMSVAGAFYPARAVELERYFEHFNKIYDESFTLPIVKSRAVVVPHAGYIYSGYTANIAYRVLQNSGVKNLLIIGPSHSMAFEGVSLCDFDNYQTPFGDIKKAKGLAQNLEKSFSLKCIFDAHKEHSTEVQFPLIKHYLEGVEIVEIVYSNADSEYISHIIDFVLDQDDCGVVVSTDLSHFYTLKDASKLDNICLNAISEIDTKVLHGGCEACGMIGLDAMLKSAKKFNLKSQILDYRTSADASSDESRVVGYVSASFG